MGDLLLTARVDLLRRNLELVQAVLDLIAERFPRVPSLPAETTETLTTVLAELADAEAALQMSADRTSLKAVRDARIHMADLAWALVGAPGSHEAPVVLPDENDFKADLVVRAQECMELLDDLERDVPTEPKDLVWARYHAIEVDAQKLFYEYVDLVRGVALRSTGLDRELCRVADALVRIVARKWRSITIPSRRERMASTSGRIIRIGFPEWTIWNVPLSVHEYGHVFTDVVPELQALLPPELPAAGADPVERARVAALMADAFAALTVGPAYGCAVMLSRLDPGAPGRGNDLVVERASIIMAALEAGRPTDEAQAMVDALRTAWAEAVSQTGHAGAAMVPHAREDELVEAVNAQCMGSRFPYKRWPDFVAPTAEALRVAARQAGTEDEPNEDATDETLDQGVDVDLRHLMNAAWLCRVRPAPEADRAITKSAELRFIANKVTDICLGWLDHVTVDAGGGSGGQRARQGGHK